MPAPLAPRLLLSDPMLRPIFALCALLVIAFSDRFVSCQPSTGFGLRTTTQPVDEPASAELLQACERLRAQGRLSSGEE